MKTSEILAEALSLQEEAVSIRRRLHQYPETGFELDQTKNFVLNKLKEAGYVPQETGRSGIIALAGGKKSGKTILLRADMDALELHEETDVEYRSKNDGKMHGCGHDMHTAMLLSAAKIIKQHENELNGTIKFEFQPAEEIFRGSVDMIESGLLENPKVDAAAMIHVIAGIPIPSGTILVSGGGISNTSCEQFHITVKGKGGHGSAPHESVDPITAAAHIHIALQEIKSRELEANKFCVFTTGRFAAGSASNIIPDTAEMWGTIRTTDPSGSISNFVKQRITEISKGIGSAFRCDVEADFYDFCPCMVIDPKLSEETLKYMKEMFGESALDLSVVSGGNAGGGSEDFAFVSHKVPTVSMFLTAGNSNEGYIYGQHNPKVRFDDSVLYLGAAAYVQTAMRWLEEH